MIVASDLEEEYKEEEDPEKDGYEAAGDYDLEALGFVFPELEDTSVESPNRSNGVGIKEINQRKIKKLLFQKPAFRVQFLLLPQYVLLPETKTFILLS